MKKIIINEPNLHQDSVPISDAKYLCLYDDFGFYCDGLTIEGTDIYATKYSIDMEEYLADWCQERSVESANGDLFVYEIFDQSDVGFTPQKEATYRKWYEERPSWQKEFPNINDYFSVMRKNDDKELNKFIECVIDGVSYFVMQRPITYNKRVTAEIN